MKSELGETKLLGFWPSFFYQTAPWVVLPKLFSKHALWDAKEAWHIFTPESEHISAFRRKDKDGTLNIFFETILRYIHKKSL